MISACVKNGFLHLGVRTLQVRRSSSCPAILMLDMSNDQYLAESKEFALTDAETSSKVSDSDSEMSWSDEEQEETLEITSVMVRHIPAKYTQKQLFAEVQEITDEFDFLYLPTARIGVKSLGYAFINFKSAAIAVDFTKKFQDHSFKLSPGSKKRAAVCDSDVQGLDAYRQIYGQAKHQVCFRA
jgi:hypothetical protein